MDARRRIAAAAGAALGAPIAALAWAARPAWRVHWRERIGDVDPGPGASSTPPVWVHAASAGEVAAAGPLVSRWSGRGLRVFGSATTETGRALWAERWPDCPRALAPLDHPWCVDRALDRVAPRALVLVETELWPVWIAAAHRRGIPVAVASGRIRDRAWRRYRRVRRWLAPTLGRLDRVGAASERDAERFVALGVPGQRVRVTGDLKLDAAAAAPPPPADVTRAVCGTPCLVAGSTHPGEEQAVADVLARVEAEGLALCAVVAPRHPERADAVERELVARGRAVRRRSRLGDRPLAAGEVLLVERIGELAALYGVGRFAFVGGTLAPVGGHNLAEPAAVGRPVLHGPHVGKVRETAALLKASGASVEVADASALGRALLRWLRDPRAAERAGERGRAALAAAGGAAEANARFVEALWSPSTAPRQGAP